MALPKPQYITNLLVEGGNNPDDKKLAEVVFAFLREKFLSTSDEEILEYIEKYQRDIVKELFIKKDESLIDGVTLNFEIHEDDGDYYIRFFDKPEIRLLRKLQSDTSENFEIFCKQILDRLGGNATVIGGKDDGGIDFTATDLSLNNLPQISTKGSRILVVGQAKRYAKGNHVKETELRTFIGACIKKIDFLKKTRSEQFGIMHPIIVAFWTTSDFHSDAREYARDLGICYLNGIALGQLGVKLGFV
jgi:restriction endonuclease Mrr